MQDNPQFTGKENQEPNHLFLTREQLYELVWSKPMQHLAKDYGISDRAMAKLCARNQVPVPPRGYWAKKNSGHKVVRPPLPAFVAKEKPKPKPSESEVQKPAKKKAKLSSAWEDREKKIKQLGYALDSRTYYMLCWTPPMIELAVTGSRETAC